MYKVVIFDLDGTVADTDMMIVEIYRRLFAKFRPDFQPSFELLLSFSGPTIKDIFDRYFPEMDIKVLAQEFMELKPYFLSTVKSYDGVPQLIAEIKKKGIKIALVTNGYQISAGKTLAAIHMEKEFDLIIGLDDVKKPKPDPEGISLVVKHFDVPKSDILFVGDAITDYLAAKDAGVDCCLVGWNLRGYVQGTNPKFLVKDINKLWEIILNGNEKSL